MSRIISLDGNIGAGKTTLLGKIREAMPELCIVDEPVDQWTKYTDGHKNILERFYEDSSRWAYTFQSCAIMTRYKNMKSMIKSNQTILTERSILTDKYIFAEMLYESGKLNKMEWDLYLQFFDLFYDDYPINGIIYVSTDYNVSKERIIKRNRLGEENISIDYLEALEKQHKKWISTTNLPVLEITTDMDISEIVEKIRKFILL